MKTINKTTLIFTSVFLTFALCPLAAALEGKAEVKVSGLRVVGDGYGEHMSGARPFSWSKGTTLAMTVAIPSGGIIEFDRSGSKLEFFKDNKGTNLLDGKGGSFSGSGFGMMPSMSKDGKVSIVEVNGPGVPITGSSGISSAGSLSFKTATQKKAFVAKNIALQIGTKIKAGNIPFEITSFGKPKWGNAVLSVTLRATQDCSSIASIQFMNVDGTAIKTSKGSTSSIGFGDTVTIDKSYNLDQKVDKANIEITYWTDMKVVHVPFNVNASVGL